ncbi:DUF72 domain-containing protein [Azospirillum thermophilum]|uniref:DUF72 domain-containing protein n=1 Tax=Azospirillum thermophilum TaxID=2202148 RepID=A0A2S2CPR0_9PROT|nr:DUF72 domain-containing protein [Azospirillum thermophilum]AWK86472.1 DUF72 domain-containing protein [Azospirillum thermophilum]
MHPHTVRIGVAGWSIPKLSAAAFPAAGTHLERYAQVFPATEVNSRFYRPHKPETWARWAASTPEDFRFAIKLPRAVTHERRLRGCEDLMTAYLAEIAPLGPRLGPLLAQLPPSLAFDRAVVADFLAVLRSRFAGDLVCEPRHGSWFREEAETLLADHRVARVAADPAPVPAAAEPGGWPGLRYWRLHGSPVMYRSKYDAAVLDRLAERIAREAAGRPVWCIFDNTADFHAVDDALAMLGRLGRTE